MSAQAEKDPKAEKKVDERKLQERVAKLMRDQFEEGGGTRDVENAISVRLTEREAKLLGDQVEFSSYENLSEYVRGVSLGWDRSAPIIAKSGVAIHWVRAWMDTMTDEQLEGLFELMEEFFGDRPTYKAMELSREDIIERLDKKLKVVEEHLLYAKEETLEESGHAGLSPSKE
ncbi:hypothetical protein [Salinibacter ruber]|jgi:hypothetical protein|uniref:Uncharacterized protein n=1 Tax=Salinibacter ruber TaxID=146919 RepID=A0A9X2QBB0_9BACT|nr:hypothetical protein [Salinibacter ruber]MCS3660167.1 hypothetical protein [Salinibacter ruber]MCS3709852.1 hypothetical protein [Salinibacter ruber]MCS4170320.1 hypothetical protein [Salinibacter ruber]